MDNDQTGIRPIDELNQLSARVDSVQELGELKPIFARVEEIAKQHAGATDIELAVKQVKTQLVMRGKKLKEAGALGTVSTPSPGVQENLPQPPQANGQGLPFTNPSSSGGPLRGVGSGQGPAYPPTPPPPAPPVLPPSPPRTSGSMSIPSLPQVPVAPPTPPPGSGQRPAAGVFAVPQPTVTQLTPPKAPLNWKRAMAIGAVIGLIGAVGILVTIVNIARKRNPNQQQQQQTSGTLAAININTLPPGAKIQINGEERCVSPCKLQLPPGDYRVQAQLEGYDPTLSPHTLVAGQPPVDVTMTLTSQAQSLRIFSDITGKVQIDGKPQGDIAEGSFILDRVAAGQHTVSVSGTNADASFAFEVTPGKAPEIKGSTTAHNLLAVVVSNAGNVARMQSSTGPLKAQLDGKDQPAIAATGTDFPSVPNGDHELIVGEGKDLKKIQVNFLPTPTLTAYLRSDINAGNLVVVTNPPEDDVMVLVNGRPLRKTSRGQLRAQQTPGNITVKVAKDGFENVAEQTAVIKKGEDTRLEFKLKSLPRVATLRIKSSTSGATVLIDGREVGKVNAEGIFQTGGVTPGDHEIEFRMAGYLNKKEMRSFKAGETVELVNVSLAKDLGVITLTLFPADTKVTYRHENEAERPSTGNSIKELVPGRYFVTGKAPGYKDKTVPITVSGGQTSTVDLTLIKDTPVVVTPTVRTGTIRDFAPGFTPEGDTFTRTFPGATFGITPVTGTFKFKIQLIKAGLVTKRIRWVIGGTQFEIEKGKFRSFEVGKPANAMVADVGPGKVYDVVIEVAAPGRITTRINGAVAGQVLDAPNLSNGQFRFALGEKDEIGVSDFSFTQVR